MITPGPVVITVAFIGYLVAGFKGALVAALGIFLPIYLMVVGLASTLPGAVSSGLEAHGVSTSIAHHAAHLPPISVLFAALACFRTVMCRSEMARRTPLSMSVLATSVGFEPYSPVCARSSR